MKVLWIFCVVLFTWVGTASSDEQVTISWESCAENSTVVTKKSICHIIDLTSNNSIYEFKVCAGVNISGGNLVFGGSASTMICATVTVEASNEEDGKAKSYRILTKALDDKKNHERAKKALKVRKIEKIGKFKLQKADKKTAEYLWKHIEMLETQPFRRLDRTF